MLEGAALPHRPAGARRPPLRRQRRRQHRRPHPRRPRRPITAADQDRRQGPRQSAATVVGRRHRLCGRRPDPVPGPIRDNLVYGLRFRPVASAAEKEREAARRLAEALRTGNPVESIDDGWIDYDLVGAKDEHELDRILLELLREVGLRGGPLPLRPVRHGRSRARSGPCRIASSTPERGCARRSVRPAWRTSSSPSIRSATTIRRRSPRTCCSAVPTSRDLIGRSLAENPGIREALERYRVERRTHRDGPQDRRDDDRDLPRASARPPPVRAVLVHRRRRARGIRGDRAPQQRARARPAGRPDAAAVAAARLYRAAPPPRTARRRAAGQARQGARARCARCSSVARSRGRVLRPRRGLRGRAAERQPAVRSRELPRRQRPGRVTEAIFRGRRELGLRSRSSGSGSITRSDPRGGS